MNTRWSTVFAALGLTVMALGSGRAAHAASVTGAGTVLTDSGDVLWFSVSAQSSRGATVVVRVGGDQFLCAAAADQLNFFGNGVSVNAVVTRSTNPLWVGSRAYFLFLDNGAAVDQFKSLDFGVNPASAITSGFITIRP
jgi:hypothetical protein